MEAPLKPYNEKTRLEALRSTELLDSNKEAVFDNLTFLVSQVFDVPVAAITLVDEMRQWFKSIYGLDVRETDRAVSFCGHIVHKGKPLVISDACNDNRFYDNPLVKDSPNIVFYAGVPLRFSYNDSIYLLGTLCIIDFVEREFTSEQLDMLKSFAYQVESLIEMRLPSQNFDLLARQLSEGAE